MTTDNRHKQLDINDAYRAAAEVLRSGGIVALPTDTVYGLVAVAADRAADCALFWDRSYSPDPSDPAQGANGLIESAYATSTTDEGKAYG